MRNKQSSTKSTPSKQDYNIPFLLAAVCLSAILFIVPIYSGVPDERLYSSFCCAFILLAFLLVSAGKEKVIFYESQLIKRAAIAVIAFLALALLSLIVRVIEDHGIKYLGPMIRILFLFMSELALWYSIQQVVKVNRGAAYILIIAAIAAAAIVSETGVNEFLMYRKVPGMETWRVFSTSTPDFLAGYLAILIPITIALFFGVRTRKDSMIGYLLAVILILIIGLETVTLLRTQSRSAIASLAVGLFILFLGLWQSYRHDLQLNRSQKFRIICFGIALLLMAALFAKPVVHRLVHTHTSDNSTSFRLYTWRGSINMALRNPIFGTGVGTYLYIYPRYDLTGFTRLAHNSYIQLADECGIPGLLAYVAAIAFVLIFLWRGLKKKAEILETNNPLMQFVALEDDRLIIAGILGGLAASCIQNLIDSDWYVFLIGVTFWSFAGIATGFVSRSENAIPIISQKRPRTELIRISQIIALIALCYMTAQGIAAISAQQGSIALKSTDTEGVTNAEQYFANAIDWDPLSAQYHVFLGNQVYFLREDKLSDAAQELRKSVTLAPTSLNYSMLGDILYHMNETSQAIEMNKKGLQIDPNNIEVRLTLAQLLPPPQSLMYYQQIADLETTPVGTARAISNLAEYKFAIADSAVADAGVASNNFLEAAKYYERAENILEEYADEGGTNNKERQVLIGGRPDPNLDKQNSDLYNHVMTSLIAISTPLAQSKLKQRMHTYQQKFAAVFVQSSQQGNLH